MELCLGVTSGMQLNQILVLSELAQKHGLNGIWIGDDINRPHDVFAVASATMLQTSRVNVGIGITSPLIRNISTIGRASAALVEIAGVARFRLGLGIGGLQDLQKLQIVVKNPRKTLRNATTLLREMWKGKTLSFQDKPFVLRNHRASYGSGKTIPVFFGVRGPMMLRLAGQIADGVVLSGSKTYLKNAMNAVRTSLRSSSQPKREFQFVAWIPTVLVEKPSDLDHLRRTVAFVLIDTPTQVLEMAELRREEIEKLRRAYRSSGIVKAASLVSEDLMEEMTIKGDAEQVGHAFKVIEKQGFDEAIFGPPFGYNVEKAIVKLARAWRQAS